MKILRIFAVLLALAAATGHSRAQDAPPPDALKAAEELFAVLSPDLLKQMMTQMNGMMWPILEQKVRSEKIDEATISDIRQALEAIQIKNLNDIMKAAPPIYARHFTADELRQLIAFYHSPIGTKALKELPQVMGEFLVAITPRIQDIQQQSVDAVNNVLKAHGYVK
jgi:hypothetical protein